MAEVVRPEIIYMVDSESTGLLPTSIVHQLSFIAVDALDPETHVKSVELFLPLAPQSLMGRTISTDWILWLLKQPKEVHDGLKNCEGVDMEEVGALVREFIRKFKQANGFGAKTYEVWFRRPQHDVPLIQSLFAMVGEEVPWKYDSVNDLATLMNLAGVGKYEIQPESGEVPHMALSDNKMQIRGWVESLKRLRSHS